MDSLPDDARSNALRLLILTDSPISVSGGSERFLRNLLGKLPAGRYQTTLVQLCRRPAADEVLHSQLPASINESLFLPFTALYGWGGLRAYLTVRSMVRRKGFNIIQSQHEKSDFFNALLPRGARHATRISSRRDTGFLKSRRLRQLSRWLNRRFDVVTAPSPSIFEAIEQNEGTLHCHTQCIPNGVDTEQFHPVDAAERHCTRASLGYADSDLLIACVADLFPVKRHADLLAAFASVRTRLQHARLILIGDGPLRGEIDTLIRQHSLADFVAVLGSRKDIKDLLPAMDLFVLPSDTEGLSNAILEAQASSLPVVATHVGGNPDLVDDSCGRLVPPRSPDILASAIGDLLGDTTLRQQMGTAARARVVRNHSLDAMAQAYQNLYHEHAHAR